MHERIETQTSEEVIKLIQDLFTDEIEYNNFIEYIERKEGTDTKGVLEDMLTRCRNAKKRGDATADPDKLAKAIVAFKSIYIG